MIYKRGKVYWYKFMFQGKLVRESTKQGNDKVARQMEAAHRTSLAKGEVGIREKKPVPTLRAFLKDRILPWAEAAFAASVPKTAKWYRNECRVLNLGVQWSVIAVAPKLKVLSGERHRERVVSQDEEARYLAAAPEPLASIATVLADTGTRPEECFRLCWEDVTWLNGRNGALLVTRGKTAAARRVIPMTPRVRAVLEARWNEAGQPEEGWVWPAGTRSGHVEPNSIYGQHLRALQASKVRPFVLYSLRHTFLTRLGESGCDAWTLARIAGHSSVAVSARYVHPSEDAVLAAISRLGGHNSGHSEQKQLSEGDGKLLATSVE